MSIPTLTCGVSQMPVVGYGTSKTDGVAVELALKEGYRHFDCAHVGETRISAAFENLLGQRLCFQCSFFGSYCTTCVWFVDISA